MKFLKSIDLRIVFAVLLFGAGLCLMAQNQVPATAPDDATKDQVIVSQAREIQRLTQKEASNEASILLLTHQNNQLKLKLQGFQNAPAQPAPLPEAGHPDMIMFQFKGDGIWKLSIRDPGYEFTVSGKTNILLHPK